MPKETVAAHSLDELIGRCWALGKIGRSSSGLAATDTLFKMAMLSGDRRAEAEILGQAAWFCLQLGLPDRGHGAAMEAKRAWLALKDTRGQSMASAVLSWLLVEMGLVDEAFAEATQCLELAQRQSDHRVLAFAQNAKAVTYLYCRQDHLAIPLLEKALETVGENEEPSLTSLFLTNLAYSQVSMAEAAELDGNIDTGKALRLKALEVNNKAIATASACGDLWNLGTALCNGAEYYTGLDELDLAERYLDRWETLGGEIGLRSEIHYLYTRGEFLTKSGRLPEALAVCQRAVELAAGHNQADHRANTCRRLAETLEAMGDYKSALSYHKQFHDAFEAQMGQTTRRRGQHVESLLENEKLRQEATRLKFEAEHDVLTGLLNRRSFESALANMQNSLFSLAIVDLDHFKAVNDNHSHIVGDSVLRQAALILSAGQAFDAYRLGGEEFALLFFDLSLQDAAELADGVRSNIEAFEWSAIAPDLQVTASIGLVSSQSTPGDEMLAKADRLLYRAKAEGRNRVIAE